MEDKFNSKFKNIFSSDSSLKRIPIYLFLICVLLITLVILLFKINQNLEIIAENGGSGIEVFTKDENYNNVLNVFKEEEKIDDILPFDKVDDTESTQTDSNVTSTTNNPLKDTLATEQENKTQQNNSTTKKEFTINVNSKKIHYSDCTFAIRTKDENKKIVSLSDNELNEYISNGYTFCKTCKGE